MHVNGWSINLYLKFRSKVNDKNIRKRLFQLLFLIVQVCTSTAVAWKTFWWKFFQQGTELSKLSTLSYRHYSFPILADRCFWCLIVCRVIQIRAALSLRHGLPMRYKEMTLRESWSQFCLFCSTLIRQGMYSSSFIYNFLDVYWKPVIETCHCDLLQD